MFLSATHALIAMPNECRFLFRSCIVIVFMARFMVFGTGERIAVEEHGEGRVGDKLAFFVDDFNVVYTGGFSGMHARGGSG